MAPDLTSPEPPVAGAPDIVGYQITAMVGRGGFATVYAARQAAVGAEVAIKVINAAEADPDTLLRFERESAAMGALRGHPHIVTVLDAGHTTDGRPFLVMELLRSGSLHSELVRLRKSGEGPMPATKVLDIGVKLAAAVATAHARGILHRDLKPGNVLLDDYGEPRLTDFGIARLIDAEASVSGQALSAGYTAPEIIQGGQPTVASDIFSLGCTLYTLLAGRSPFLRTTDAGLLPALNRTVEEAAPDLRVHGVPDAVCRVIEYAMAKAPGERYVDAREMGAALRAAQEEIGEPPSQAPFPDSGPTISAAPGPSSASPTLIVDDLPGTGEQDALVRRPLAAAGADAAPPVAAPVAPELAQPVAPRGQGLRHPLVVVGALLLGLFAIWWWFSPDDELPDLSAGASTEETPVVLSAEVQDGTSADTQAELVTLYESWQGLINSGDLPDAFALHTPGYQRVTSMESFAGRWTLLVISNTVVASVQTGIDGQTFTRVTYVAMDAVDDGSGIDCQEVTVEHELVPGADGLQIAGEAELEESDQFEC